MLRLLKNTIEQGASKVWERHNLLLSKTENNKTCTSSLTPLFDTDKCTLTVYHGISLESQLSLLVDLYRYLGVLLHRKFPPPLPPQVCPKNNEFTLLNVASPPPPALLVYSLFSFPPPPLR